MHKKSGSFLCILSVDSFARSWYNLVSREGKTSPKERKKKMALKIFCAFIALVFIGTLLTMAIVKPDTYTLSAVVIRIDRAQDLVKVKDSNGNYWEYYGAKSTDEGQPLALLMNGKHTDEIEDDEIIDVDLFFEAGE